MGKVNKSKTVTCPFYDVFTNWGCSFREEFKSWAKSISNISLFSLAAMDVIWLMVLVHSIAAMVMVCCRHIQLFCHNWLNKMALTLTHGCIFGGFPSWWYCTLCWDQQEWFLNHIPMNLAISFFYCKNI